MKASLVIETKKTLDGVAQLLPASKSINNRVLIMNALAGGESKVFNMSDANDVKLMLKLVNAADEVIDVEDAGTTMRFLTAYFSVTGKHKTLTGTQRMKERPIGLLVDALRTLGVQIEYLEKEGFPPIKTLGFSEQKATTIKIRGDVSSQYISALMMVAPVLPKGLTLELQGKIGSRPYIEMTASLMKAYGINTTFTGNTISILPQTYQPIDFTVESDWSAASYWFSFTALAEKAEVFLPKISLNSLQGDRAIVDIMKPLGVNAKMVDSQLQLTKGVAEKSLTWDFTHCPDLAQTVAVVCAAKGIEGTFTGLESLRIKETDRIAALQNELSKIGATLEEIDSANWKLHPSKGLPAEAFFNTYKDHRMAMAFAPLATMMKVEIENPTVVKKSYPRFWDDLNSFGFKFELKEEN